ncbi:nucleoside triphosphate pyrophosphohydrolase [Methylocystis sp. MJC1]|jgi:tetrapyrrole methylase family protein/MazG family protein/ATP diphosphatase|uniref:nucleoside triphosphate pyrophosphohydrolase n=1 Tax=Methylocystis sp. MJC1 TaxID=2654282 RepID=UPI0013EE116F|nr:nucleoside triphosphate pyrophosphohydrolase [Methylocystis sp. MJC1]KAF2992122.1 Nucleoside triphosphate pyrophosphohydrolase [Methylocystis sp. MJC1]MBU6527263.1 nucleoside triphosphate pyrophosphohydrolase [Methylocystis sp. MJC1]UZX10220.1 nucleoside triphosphate pyrophosphohydrolase [Methylocystis sp. MJC1]
MPGDIARLIEIMAALRTPGTGCPWDLEQDSRSIAPYAVEEAYEVVEAIEFGDLDDLRDELGDLLLQVVFHSRIAQEQSAFAFPDVVKAICDKLVRRHPHVFGEGEALTPDGVTAQWNEIKAAEKAAKGAPAPASLLDGVPLALPALVRAVKLQQKASKVGFDWNDAAHVMGKIREETEEVADELRRPDLDPKSLEEEIGDLLFVVSNLARHAKVDPEQALRGANAKFERRFHHIEKRLAEMGSSPDAASLDEMEALWVEAKQLEKGANGDPAPEATGLP